MTAPVAPTAAAALRSGDKVHEMAATLVLIRSKALPSERLSARLEDEASAVTILQDIAQQRVLASPFSPEDLTMALEEARGWKSAKLDVRLVYESAYPRNLLAIFNRPPILFVRGRWDEDRDSLGVAVVGTRNASADGLKRATYAARRLAEAGITVISGLARGIDAAAHLAALNAGGRTVAVMGTGLNSIYPRENEVLADDIVRAGGALMTQFAPDQPPTKWTFPMRNVVMSGLSIATIVVEASETSGARSQARSALEHGRTVFLPSTLVASHAWAKRMVDVGVNGVRAVEVTSPDAIVDRILSIPDDLIFAAG